MATLVIRATVSRVPGSPDNYDLGDIISILPDGQHPGVKAAADERFAFISVPGEVEDWDDLLEEHIGPDGEPLARRRHMTTALGNDVNAQQALAWGSHPSLGTFAMAASCVDKGAPPGP